MKFSSPYISFSANMKALKTISFLIFILAGTTYAQNSNIKCPFQSLYEFGDGVADNGNSVKVFPFGLFLPATRYPYGRTFPGRPNGRWSDGLVAVDYAGQGLGLPNIKPYLKLGPFTSNDGVTFAVQGSTILNNSFFNSKGIDIPQYNTPLSTQIRWFKRFLRSTCTINQRDCLKRQPSNSLITPAFIEANDIGYALAQGKSIDEVKSYVPLLVEAQINAARELIKLGANRLAYHLAAPLGCYPYILTALFTNDTTAYDELGCLKPVNNLIVSYNNDLQTAFNALVPEFPTVAIFPYDYYTSTRTVINQTVLGPNGNLALKSCCGVGGRYNYDKRRFCGSLKVPVCPNPNDYIYWDGLHFTQEAHRRIVNVQLAAAVVGLNCTSS